MSEEVEITRTSVRLPTKLMMQLTELAKRERRSVNYMFEVAVASLCHQGGAPSLYGSPPAPIYINNTPPSLIPSNNINNSLVRPRPRVKRAESDPAFEAFWLAYPRKTGKIEARRAWDRAMGVTTPEVIEAALRAAKWAHDPRFIPHPSTWLNQGRWDDQPAPARPRDEDMIPL